MTKYLERHRRESSYTNELTQIGPDRDTTREYQEELPPTKIELDESQTYQELRA